MKTEELTALGLTDEQVKSVFALHGKDITPLQQQIADLTKSNGDITAERDNLNTQLTAANDTLNKFGDLTPESMQAEIQKYKQQADDAEKNFNAQITARDQKDWITKKLDEYGVTSPYARAALTSELMAADSGLTWKDNSFFGFDDFMKAAKAKDTTLYQTADEKAKADKQTKLEGDAPSFVAPLGQQKPQGDTKKDIPKVW